MPDRRVDFPQVLRQKHVSFNTKEVVDDKEPPQKIESIDFSICSGEQIVRNAVMEVKRDDMYTSVPTAPGQASIREAAPNGYATPWGAGSTHAVHAARSVPARARAPFAGACSLSAL